MRHVGLVAVAGFGSGARGGLGEGSGRQPWDLCSYLFASGLTI